MYIVKVLCLHSSAALWLMCPRLHKWKCGELSILFSTNIEFLNIIMGMCFIISVNQGPSHPIPNPFLTIISLQCVYCVFPCLGSLPFEYKTIQDTVMCPLLRSLLIGKCLICVGPGVQELSYQWWPIFFTLLISLTYMLLGNRRFHTISHLMIMLQQ